MDMDMITTMEKNKRMIDIHNHLLFDTDDGVKTIEESLDVLKDLENYGFTDIILTPHYISGTKYSNSIKDNYKKLKELRLRLDELGLNINLYLGNEIHIDEDIIDNLKKGYISTMNGTRYILVELPMTGEYEGYIDLFKDLISKGCIVILAHPERYTSIQDNFDLLYELKDIGVLFQSNIDSIIGKYGDIASNTIIRMLKERLVNFLAKDIHKKKTNYNKWKIAKLIALKYISEEEYNILINENPSFLIKNNYYK